MTPVAVEPAALDGAGAAVVTAGEGLVGDLDADRGPVGMHPDGRR